MDQDKWLIIDGLAEYLKMGRTKLYRLTQDGEIPASKVGTQWRFGKNMALKASGISQEWALLTPCYCMKDFLADRSQDTGIPLASLLVIAWNR